MGQSESIPMGDESPNNNPTVTSQPSVCSSGNNRSSGGGGANHSTSRSCHIEELIGYARQNYHDNPTESLAALMEALTLNSGRDSANVAMERLRTELGEDISNAIGSHHIRMQRAMQIVSELLEDSSTLLYEQGRQDILRQTMQDGSSVLCKRCHAVVSSARWQQHQAFWCQANNDEDDEDTPMANAE
jgi:hypothetical protein